MPNVSLIMSAIPGTVFLVAALAVAAAALSKDGNVDLRARLRFVKDGWTGDAEGASRGLRGLISGALDLVSRRIWRFSIVGEKQREALRLTLLQAGVRRPDAVRLLLTIKIMSMLVFGLVIPSLGVVAGVLSTELAKLLMVGMAAALVGGLVPEYALRARASKRRERILRRLPDALDLLIIFANAGYGLDMAIQRLSVDLARSAPDLSDEFAVTSDQLRLSSDRDRVLSDLAARSGLEAMRSLVSTLTQSQKYGTPLSQALRVLAAEQRNKAIIEMEERAAKMPVLITIPLIVLILPAVLIIAGTPAFIQMGKVWSGAVESSVGR